VKRANDFVNGTIPMVWESIFQRKRQFRKSSFATWLSSSQKNKKDMKTEEIK